MREIKRENVLARVRPFYHSQYIKAITGVRRCGKSVVLRQIISELKENGTDEEHILYLDLEGRSGEGITTRRALEEKLDSLIQGKGKYYIFIDEVQHIRAFEEAIASVRVSYDCSLFVTGSNSKLLRGKLQDRLTGRVKEFQMGPFTYAEAVSFKEANDIPINEGDFEDYLEWGGIPQRYEEQDEAGLVSFYQGLYHSIVEKDVFGEHKKINRTEFEKVAGYAMMNSGRPFSALALARALYPGSNSDTLKSRARTIANYMGYLEDCYLLLPCPPYYVTGRKYLSGERKVYCVDQGFRSSFTNTVDFDPSFGLENIVYQELRSRGYLVRFGKLYNGEIDFVVVRGRKKAFLQVCYHLYDEKTVQREYGAFLKIRDASPKYVLSLDRIDSSRDGVSHIYLIDFLLGKVDILLT